MSRRLRAPSVGRNDDSRAGATAIRVVTVFHFPFAPTTIGLALFTAYCQTKAYRTGKEVYRRTAGSRGSIERVIKVLLADDHEVVRTGLKLLVNAEDDLTVVAEAGEVAEVARYTRGHGPDVLVLDLNMPGGSSLEAIPWLRKEFPDTAIVVLTMQSDPAFAREAMGAGALGYVLKHSAATELVEAVRAANAGDTYINPRLGGKIAAARSGSPDDLSVREVEVLSLLALGHTNAEIAERLYLSARTVETHRAHIQRKTQRSTRAELVRYALDHGLVA